MEARNSIQNVPVKVEALCWKVWDYRKGQAQTLTLRNVCFNKGDRQKIYDNTMPIGVERRGRCSYLICTQPIPVDGKKFQGQTVTFICNLCRLEDYFLLLQVTFKDRYLGFFSVVNKMTVTNKKNDNLFSSIKISFYSFSTVIVFLATKQFI